MTRLTVKNRASEITDELDQHVLFLSAQLVEASLAAAVLDFGRGQTLLDVGVEPFLRNLVKIASLLLTKKSLEEGLLLLLGSVVSVLLRGLGGSLGETTVAVGRDVADEVGVLALILIRVPAVSERDSLALGIAVLKVLFVGHGCCWRGESVQRNKKREDSTALKGLGLATKDQAREGKRKQSSESRPLFKVKSEQQMRGKLTSSTRVEETGNDGVHQRSDKPWSFDERR
jgi:hypothetical protein